MTNVRSRHAGYVIIIVAATLLILALLLTTGGCARRTTAQAPASRPSTSGGAGTAATAAPPAALSSVESDAEDIYDVVKSGNWSKAGTMVAKLKKDQKSVDSAVKDQAGNKKRLATQVSALNKAITAKNKHSAMLSANAIGLIVADMSEPYRNRVPVAIARLDYYGRQLEIWSSVKNMAELQKTAKGLKTTWAGVRPDVIKHGGTAQAKKFDALVAKVEAASTPEQYGKLATPILDQVDNLEGVYTKGKG